MAYNNKFLIARFCSNAYGQWRWSLPLPPLSLYLLNPIAVWLRVVVGHHRYGILIIIIDIKSSLMAYWWHKLRMALAASRHEHPVFV